MAAITISEAANLTGKSIKTIYRHIKNGKLSSIQNENNIKTIDISELIRVYGELKHAPEQINSQASILNNNKMSLNENNITPTTKNINSLTEIDKRLLEERIKSLELILNEKQAHIESLQKAMLLIENKTEQQNSQTKEKNWLQKIFS